MTLGNIIEKSAKKYLNKEAVIFRSSTLTYKTLNSRSTKLASGLKKIGIKKGDIFSILLPNLPEFFISYFAGMKLGAIVLPLNPSYKETELKCFLNDSKASAIITTPELVPLICELKKDIPSLSYIITTGKKNIQGAISIEKIIDNASAHFKGEKLSENDPAVLLYTSGVTSSPKGAILTHKNLLSNVKSIVKVNRIKKSDCIICVLPLFHSYGITVCINAPILLGAKVVLLEKFVPHLVLDAIKKFKATIFLGVPTMFAYILNQPGVDKKDVSSLKICLSGGASLSPDIAIQFKQKFGIDILEGYGLTEASPVVCCTPFDGIKKVGSVGLPVPNVEVKIVDDNGCEVKQGEVGEIIVKGPNVMKEYLNNPEATSSAIRDGWLFTGDLGRCDEDGYYYIVGRKKDMIIVGGFNVYPQEVENVLLSHPDVLEAAVIGKQDKYKGELIKAFVVLKPESNATYEDIMNFCSEKLAPYKVPRILEFRDVLPKTDTGKILKTELK